MKQGFLIFIVLFFASSSISAQEATTKTTNWGIGFRQIWLDYQSPLQKDLFKDLNTNFGDMGHGAEIIFHKGIKKYLDISIPLRLGANSFPIDSFGHTSPSTMFYGADALFKLHTARSKFLSPYLVFGAGGMMNNRERKADLQFPLGLGIDFRLGHGVYFNAETKYRYALSDLHSSLQHSLGFMFDFGAPAVKKPVELPPADSDGDGIVDKDDKCPNVKGLAALNGCPDADGDGIADADDECPNEKGTIALKGCPQKDADGDGVLDADDKCPNEKGPSSNNGCPIKDRDGDGYNDDIDDCPDMKGTVNGCPDADGDGTIDPKDKCPNVKGLLEHDGCPDTDGDGIVDSQDRCPNKAGTKSNKGCPEMKKEDKARLTFATKNIQFNTAKTTLASTSTAIMDEIAAMMLKYPDYSLSISGHTDSVGSASSNLKLSEGRAKTCYNYLVKKGISPNRMSHAGYGETQPIADNMTKAGRKMNRRVEFNMYLR